MSHINVKVLYTRCFNNIDKYRRKTNMPEDPPYLEFTDEEGKTYTFTQSNYEHHSYHSELAVPNFKDRIKRAVLSPNYIYPAFKMKNRYCFYYLEYSIGTRERYTKVVVEVGKSKRYSIITAFRPDKIQEKKYFSAPLEDRP